MIRDTIQPLTVDGLIKTIENNHRRPIFSSQGTILEKHLCNATVNSRFAHALETNPPMYVGGDNQDSVTLRYPNLFSESGMHFTDLPIIDK
jgi:hypothetical protein